MFHHENYWQNNPHYIMIYTAYKQEYVEDKELRNIFFIEWWGDKIDYDYNVKINNTPKENYFYFYHLIYSYKSKDIKKFQDFTPERKSFVFINDDELVFFCAQMGDQHSFTFGVGNYLSIWKPLKHLINRA